MPKEKTVTIKLSRTANETAKSIVRLVELETDSELGLEACMKIAEFVQLAIDVES